MKRLFLALLAVATALAIVPKASADSITGTLNITSVFPGSVSAGPTGLTFTNPAQVGTSTGDFAALGGDDVSMIHFVSAVDSGSLVLFTGFDGLSYDVTSYTYTDVGGDYILDGIGVMSLGSDTPTDYDFSLTTQGGGVTSFSLTAESPEPPSLLLLATGLLGLAFVAFQKAKGSTGLMVSM